MINTFIKLAEAQEAQGNLQDALTILTSALKTYPDDTRLRLARGRIYLALGNQKAALFDAQKAAQSNPELLEGINGSLGSLPPPPPKEGVTYK